MLPVNYVAILVCGVISLVIGAIWYSPALFAKPWMKAIGKTEEELKAMRKDAWKGYITAFISSLVLAFAIAVLLQGWGIHRVIGGVKLGLLAGIGVSAASWLPSFMFERRSLVLFMIDAGYAIVTMVAFGAVLVAWR